MFIKKMYFLSVAVYILIIAFSNTCYASISNAELIQLNVPIYGSLPKTDTKNYYEITLPSDGFVRLDFEHANLTENKTGWRIKLIDEDSKQIESFSSKWNEPLTSSASIGLPGGTYYVLVEASTYHHKADYQLTVNFSSSSYWEKELNDEILKATAIDLNRPYSGSINLTGDKDYYQFTLPSDGYVRLDFEHANQTENKMGWRIRLIDEDSNEMESFSSKWNDPLVSSANIGLPGGTYYVLVGESTYPNTADYQLTVNFGSSSYWEKEFNDKMLEATSVDFNRPYSGSINLTGDKDYYRFTLPSDGYVRLDFEHANLTENQTGWRIRLIDEDSNEIESFSSKWNDPLVSSANIRLPGGTYYVLVEASTYPNTADYQLTVLLDPRGSSDEERISQPDSEPLDEIDELLPGEYKETEVAGLEQISTNHLIIFGFALLFIMLMAILLIKVRSN